MVFSRWGAEKAILVEHISILFCPQNRRRPLPFSKFLEIVVACETQHQAHHVLPHIDLLEYAGASTISP